MKDFMNGLFSLSKYIVIGVVAIILMMLVMLGFIFGMAIG